MAFMVDREELDYKHFCKICYKGFVSGRALGGHMRAHGVGDNIHGMGNMAAAAGEESEWGPEEMEGGGCRSLWKRKRSIVGSFSLAFPSSEEEELAKCLMLLANNDQRDDDIHLVAEESISSGASREEERRTNIPATNHKGGVFECKACKKVFRSHQALGGHRASHKRVKGCFAAHPPPADLDHAITVTRLRHLASPAKRKSKMHECSICHRVFTSGQALGGHKRCHWITSNSPETPSPAKFHHHHYHHMEQIYKRPKFNKPTTATIDLNLPAPADDMTGKLQVLHHNSHYDDRDQNNNDNESSNYDNDYNNYSKPKVDDEAHHKNKLKLAKLSDINHEMSMNGGSSQWLQVGICSTLEVGSLLKT